MGEETTWFDLLPGVHNLQEYARHYFSRTELGVQAFPSAFSLTHVFAVALVFVFVAAGALVFRVAMARGGEQAIVPPATLTFRNFVELFTYAILGVAEGIMGEKNARRYLPLIGTLAFFIFFSNCLALIPGFVPPTSTPKTNLALALTVFVMTHYYGVREHGLAYFKHFLGPVWWLAPLMLPIELISHIARPVALTMRLGGNIAADHRVWGAFFFLVPLFVPIPFLILGVMVCVIQTLVFCLLSMVYIQGAVAAHEGHEDHEHGAHAHGH
jgi:F-type H+-transporting ATPase subunit a